MLWFSVVGGIHTGCISLSVSPWRRVCTPNRLSGYGLWIIDNVMALQFAGEIPEGLAPECAGVDNWRSGVP